MTTTAAIVLGSIIIAAAIIGAQFVPRYQIVSTGYAPMRLDTRTGEVAICSASATVVTCRP